MSQLLPIAFDLLLAFGLVLLAAALLFGRELFTSAVLFVAFGLLASLAWVRLHAADVALAEAAVGAGLTGALVLRAAGQMPRAGRLLPLRALPTVAAVLLTGALSLALAIGVLTAAPAGPGLGRELLASSQNLGLEQAVTAVLLVFRGFDTWLELAVVLTALLALLGSRPAGSFACERLKLPDDPMLLTVARTVLPLAIVLGSFVLWQGTRQPGGAFQGGAVLATALVLGYLAGLQVFRSLGKPGFRLLAIIAFGLPPLLSLPALLAGGALLGYPSGDPGGWLLPIELAIGSSMAVTLAALFSGAEPGAERNDLPPGDIERASGRTGGPGGDGEPPQPRGAPPSSVNHQRPEREDWPKDSGGNSGQAGEGDQGGRAG